MFNWFKRFLERREDARFEAWMNRASAHYVYRYLPQLNDLARKLSNGRIVKTRFNEEAHCVEMYVPRHETLARIHVQGECCAPTTAIICTSLPSPAKELIASIFQSLQVEYRPLAA